jgi:hypothetical protein
MTLLPGERGGEVLEFAHAATSPEKTFILPGGTSNSGASTCAVDNRSGDVAVPTEYGRYRPYIVIFKNGNAKLAKRHPIDMKNPIGLSYDNAGNLYVVGTQGSGATLFELPRGQTSFVEIAVDLRTTEPQGTVQWTSHHLTIESFNQKAIYQISISGRHGKVIGETQLESPKTHILQSWIYGSTVFAIDGNAHHFAYWPYPAGGDPENVKRSGTNTWGITFSPAQP